MITHIVSDWLFSPCCVEHQDESIFERVAVAYSKDYEVGRAQIKFRTRNHMLPVETGRWRRIPRENRKCHLCHLDIGDEYHYLINCNFLNNLRRQYIDRKFYVRPNVIMFSMLLNSTHPAKLQKLCTFIKCIFDSL